jgi:glycosyltransferase involved in cell wall biosynthesis
MVTKVSVCIGTYNQVGYIAECIRSVLMQADASIQLEILVGDDASTDGTSDVVRSLAAEHPGVVVPHIRPSNLGAARNYQALVAAATGDFIAHLDGDDYWLPGKLRRQVSLMLQRPHCAVSYTNALVVSSDDVPLGVFSSQVPDEFSIEFLASRGNFLHYGSMLYRANLKSVILELVPPFIDYRMHLALARHGKIGWLKQAGTVYRVETSTSMIKNNRDHVRKLGWEALTGEFFDLAVSRKVKVEASATFFLPILSLALQGRRWSYLREWGGMIRHQTSGTGRCLLFWRYVILMAVGRAVRGVLIRAGARINQPRVFYFR